MDTTGGSDEGMQVEDGGIASFPSSNVMGNARSDQALTISKPSTAAHSFFSAGWDSFVLLNHNENLVSQNEPFASNFDSVGNQVIGGSSYLFAGQPFTDSRLSYFGNGNLSETVVGSFTMSEFIGISDSGCPSNFGSYMNDGGGSEINLREGVKSHECRNLKDGAGGDSPTNGRTRKRSPDSRSSYDLSENNHNKLQGNSSGKSLDALDDQVEKKQKHEGNEGPNIPKQSTGQAKDNLSSEEVPKEYVHVRARRGQATNSHSLAERIRREKISDRMRLLQGLVPGCSKIIGKAVMLDEIINYVQSLQQQVEFLSMKLATIIPDIPDICFDARKPLPMDINSQHTSVTAPGLGNPGLGSFQHFSPGMSKGTLPISPSKAQYLSLSQLPLDSDLHSLYHTGFGSNPADIPKAEGEIPSRSPLSSFGVSPNKQVCLSTGQLKPEQ